MYPNATVLLVYFDIGRFSFKDMVTPFHTQLLQAYLQDPFNGTAAFSRVLVMFSDMKSLVQLHPEAVTYVEDNPNPL